MVALDSQFPKMTEAPWPSPARAWWAVVGVVFAAFLSLMDRLVLNLLVDPIRSDLHISETEFSLLQAASFAVVSSLLAIPLGLAADRVPRRDLLVFGVAVWSLATAWGGLSTSYHQLLAARILVGMGEAALWPVVVSLFADLLPPFRRGRAIGMVTLAQILGGGASLAATGFIIRGVAAGAFRPIPGAAIGVAAGPGSVRASGFGRHSPAVHDPRAGAAGAGRGVGR
jgi:predicted MFS family arabinose efflux permease